VKKLKAEKITWARDALLAVGVLVYRVTSWVLIAGIVSCVLVTVLLAVQDWRENKKLSKKAVLNILLSIALSGFLYYAFFK